MSGSREEKPPSDRPDTDDAGPLPTLVPGSRGRSVTPVSADTELPVFEDDTGRRRVETLEFVGSGAFGDVYRARDGGRASVACKVVSLRGQHPDRLAQRMFERDRVLFELRHANIVHSLYSFRSTRYHVPVYVLVMEWLAGRDFGQVFDAGYCLSLNDTIAAFSGCCDALAYAAEQGVIHRDIKPRNLLLCDDGVTKLLDFDICRIASTEGSSVHGIAGTPGYIAPERYLAIGASRGNETSDVFSFGVTLYECLTGTRLFSELTAEEEEAEGARSVLDWARSYSVRDVDFVFDVFKTDPELETLMRGCLEADPIRRIPTFADLGQRLAGVGQTGAARRVHGTGADVGQSGGTDTRVGHFRLRELLDFSGTYGVVWRVDSHLFPDRPLVAKLLNRTWHEPRFVRRFEREADALRALSDCRHVPQLVEYYTGTDANGRPQYAIIMEDVGRSTLRSLIEQHPEGVPVARAMGALRCVAEALAFAHSRPDPIIHRDVKPENVVCQDPGSAKLVDFGVAHEAGGSRFTECGIKGTPNYTAPDFITVKGFRGDPSSDIFSFGVSLYEALTGRLPYPPLQSLLPVVFEGWAQSLSVSTVDWDHGAFRASAGLQALVRGCLDTDRDSRWSSMRAVADRINAWLDDSEGGQVFDFDVVEDRDASLLVESAGQLYRLVPAGEKGSARRERVKLLVRAHRDVGSGMALPERIVECRGSTSGAVPEAAGVSPLAAWTTPERSIGDPEGIIRSVLDAAETLERLHLSGGWHGEVCAETVGVVGHTRLVFRCPSFSATVSRPVEDEHRRDAARFAALFLQVLSAEQGSRGGTAPGLPVPADPDAYFLPPLPDCPTVLRVVPELSRVLYLMAYGRLPIAGAVRRLRTLIVRPHCGRAIGGARVKGWENPRCSGLTGCYEFLNELDSGGCGQVWKVRRLSDGTIFALKSPHPGIGYATKALRREARLLPSLTGCEAIVRVEEAFVAALPSADPAGAPTRACLVMEYLDGLSLREIIRQRARGTCRYSGGEIIRAFQWFCRALEFCHSRRHPVVHRDVKPGNLFVPSPGKGVPKLLDFGIARSERGTQSVGRIPGTSEYMAPECAAPTSYGKTARFRGDELSDIFALGLCMYEAMAGRRAFAGSPLTPPREGLDRHLRGLKGRAERLRDTPETETWFVRDGLPEKLVGVLQRALRPLPAGRFQSATELREALDRLSDTWTEEDEDALNRALTRPLQRETPLRTIPEAPAPEPPPRTPLGSRLAKAAAVVLTAGTVVGLEMAFESRLAECYEELAPRLLEWVAWPLLMKRVERSARQSRTIADVESAAWALELIPCLEDEVTVDSARESLSGSAVPSFYREPYGRSSSAIANKVLAERLKKHLRSEATAASSAGRCVRVADGMAARRWVSLNPETHAHISNLAQKRVMTQVRVLLGETPDFARIREIRTAFFSGVSNDYRSGKSKVVDDSRFAQVEARVWEAIKGYDYGGTPRLASMKSLWDIITTMDRDIRGTAAQNLSERAKRVAALVNQYGPARQASIDETQEQLGHLLALHADAEKARSEAYVKPADADHLQALVSELAETRLLEYGTVPGLDDVGAAERELAAISLPGAELDAWTSWVARNVTSLGKLGACAAGEWPDAWKQKYQDILPTKNRWTVVEPAQSAIDRLLAQGSEFSKCVAALSDGTYLENRISRAELHQYDALNQLWLQLRGLRLDEWWLSKRMAAVVDKTDPLAERERERLKQRWARHQYDALPGAVVVRGAFWRKGEFLGDEFKQYGDRFALKQDVQRAWKDSMGSLGRWDETGANEALNTFQSWNPNSVCLPEVREIAASMAGLRAEKSLQRHAEALGSWQKSVENWLKYDGPNAQPLLTKWAGIAARLDALAQPLAGRLLNDLEAIVADYPLARAAADQVWHRYMQELAGSQKVDALDLPAFPERILERHAALAEQVASTAESTLLAEMKSEKDVEHRAERLRAAGEQIGALGKTGLFSRLEGRHQKMRDILAAQKQLMLVFVQSFRVTELQLMLAGRETTASGVRPLEKPPGGQGVGSARRRLPSGEEALRGSLLFQPGGGKMLPLPPDAPAPRLVKWTWERGVPAELKNAGAEVQITVDGQPVIIPPAADGEGTPVPLGKYEGRVTAPGYQPHRIEADVAAVSGPVILFIPALDPEEQPEPSLAEQATAASRSVLQALDSVFTYGAGKTAVHIPGAVPLKPGAIDRQLLFDGLPEGDLPPEEQKTSEEQWLALWIGCASGQMQDSALCGGLSSWLERTTGETGTPVELTLAAAYGLIVLKWPGVGRPDSPPLTLEKCCDALPQSVRPSLENQLKDYAPLQRFLAYCNFRPKVDRLPQERYARLLSQLQELKKDAQYTWWATPRDDIMRQYVRERLDESGPQDGGQAPGAIPPGPPPP